MAKQRTLNEIRQSKEYQIAKETVNTQPKNPFEYEEVDKTVDQIVEDLQPQIFDAIFQMINDEMAEKYVFDSSRPIGAKNKTRHALDAYLRPPEKEFFVTSVESQLNKFGYTLYDHVNEKGIGKIFDPTSSEKGFIPTVLVPMFPELVRAEDQTFMPMKLVYVSEIGDYELQPIIINEGTDKEFTAAFQIKDEFKNYLGSVGSVTDAIGLEGLQKLFEDATTLLGGDRSKPVPLVP